MQIYLAVTPQQVRESLRWRCGLAHVAYRIGPDDALLRQNLLLDTRGGLLSLSDQDGPEIRDPEKLSHAVVRECRRRNYSGVILDFEGPAAPDRVAFAAALEPILTRSQQTLYVPEEYGSAAPNGVMLLCTALSGGTLQERLREAVQQRDARHTALDLQRLRMDFLLPEKTGMGTPLSGDDLRQLIRTHSPAIFFSQDLCARYFTYSKQGKTHFVLFDDAGTLRQKMQAGAALGIQTAFLMYPEVWDLLPQLFGR